MSDNDKIKRLRMEAEKILEENEKLSNNNSINEDMAHLLEELSIHQIELEMQNDELQRSQQELEYQKNKFIDLFENAPVAYITVTVSGNIVYKNKKAGDIFGRGSSNRDFNFISIFPYIDQSSKTTFRKTLKNAFISREEADCEIRMLSEGKTLLHTEIHMIVYFDSEREEDLCRITITSIENVRKAFNSKLEASEEKYRELAENINEGIYLTENGYIKMVNKSVCRLFAYEYDELIDRKVWELVKPEKQEETKNLFLKKVEDSDNSPVDVECIRKDGSVFWAEISMRIIKDKSKVFGVISDITARKKAEDALRQSEQRLHLALKGTKAQLWDWNITTGHIDFDDQCAEILGYSPSEIEPHFTTWEKIIHPEDLDLVNKLLSNHLEGKTEFYQSVHRLKTEKGLWKYILDSGMVIARDDNGNPLRAVGTWQDITEQKETEQKLREINATKDKLFSIIAHDLKSPYNAQLGFLELLLENDNSYTEEQRKRFIKTVYNSTKQSFALLDNLLVWSRTQTGKIPFNPEQIYLAQLFEEVIELQSYSAQAKKIMIDTNLCNDNLEITADYEMVNTILRNLLSNAVKFTPDNGQIILGAKTVSDDKVMIYVEDSGVGIPEGVSENLFDPTNNYTTIGTNKEKGTGIGLIICQDFVQRNGGKIWVDSEEGKGSTFYFTLDSYKKKNKCGTNCIQNFSAINEKIKQDKELHAYFLKTIIPFFRHAYQKFSDEEIRCFIDELKTLSKEHDIEEFKKFTDTIINSLHEKDSNQINICFAEFEKLTDEIEIVATKSSHS